MRVCPLPHWAFHEKYLVSRKYLIAAIILFISSAAIYIVIRNNFATLAEPRLNRILKMRDIYNNPIAKLETDFIIVNFWASWCPPCIEETPSLIQFTKRYSKHFTLIALSQDTTKKEIEDFVKIFPAMKSPFITVVHDDSQSAAHSFNVNKLPETLIYSVKENKFLQLSGSTNWGDPKVIEGIAKYFNLPL